MDKRGVQQDTARRLRYASGYLELGMLNEASDELESIAFEDRLTDPVLRVRLEFHMAAEHWETVVGVARELTDRGPKDERAWICLAYALRELNRVLEARDVLLEAERRHGHDTELLHYNMACYCCLLGDLTAARDRLSRACQGNSEMKRQALDDPDLEALWGETPPDSQAGMR